MNFKFSFDPRNIKKAWCFLTSHEWGRTYCMRCGKKYHIFPRDIPGETYEVKTKVTDQAQGTAEAGEDQAMESEARGL